MEKTSHRLKAMCMAALLCAIGILIPMLSPVRFQVGPMSFTLASHVALFIALFLSPAVGAVVTVGTTLGFLLAGFPPVVVARAAVQIVFVIVGALWLAKKPGAMSSPAGILGVGLVLGVLHAVCEAVVVTLFWFGGATYNEGFLYTIVGLVGVGTLVHSMVDYAIALVLWKPVAKAARLKGSYIPA